MLCSISDLNKHLWKFRGQYVIRDDDRNQIGGLGDWIGCWDVIWADYIRGGNGRWPRDSRGPACSQWLTVNGQWSIRAMRSAGVEAGRSEVDLFKFLKHFLNCHLFLAAVRIISHLQTFSHDPSKS